MSVGEKKTVDGVETITLPCCACAGKVSFATPETTAHPTFFHTMPFCARFEETNTADDLATYVRDCRIASEN